MDNKFSPLESGFTNRQLMIGLLCVGFIAIVLGLVLPPIGSTDRGSYHQRVIIYTSQDEEYAEPIFQDFEKSTGIKVMAVFDSEAVKTVGLVNRLLAESSNPQCDVFWNNEELRTRMLATKNIFRETNGWVQLGYRSRRLAMNTNHISVGDAPHKFLDATNTAYRGKVALAYPLFGTTASHFLCLRQAWGDAAWQNWCRALVANKPFIVDGNSVAAKQVGSGEAFLAFTDSDDAAAEQREGAQISILPLADDSLIIHNTAGIIRGAPHPDAAQKLLDYLRSEAVQQKLVDKHALESATPANPKTQPGLKVDWDALLKDMDTGTEELKQIFLR